VKAHGGFRLTREGRRSLKTRRGIYPKSKKKSPERFSRAAEDDRKEKRGRGGARGITGKKKGGAPTSFLQGGNRPRKEKEETPVGH